MNLRSPSSFIEAGRACDDKTEPVAAVRSLMAGRCYEEAVRIGLKHLRGSNERKLRQTFGSDSLHYRTDVEALLGT